MQQTNKNSDDASDRVSGMEGGVHRYGVHPAWRTMRTASDTWSIWSSVRANPEGR